VRSSVASAIASETDVEQAYAVGRAAVEFTIAGRSAVMPAIRRLSDAPYRWDIIEVPLSEVANQEKLLPPNFISADGFGITEAPRRYWRRSSSARPIRHSRMGCPTM
jgi:6-phosphofructokinase 1